MRAAVGFALMLALATTAATGQVDPNPSERDGEGRRFRVAYADPSAVIAADLALSRTAREKGQWRAWRDRAATGAIVFAPRPTDAAAWLRGRSEPAVAGRWQPRKVWMSCDGRFAVTRGAWVRGADSGDYVAVWQRQKKGDWKWLVREEAPAGELGEAPEMIAAQVAECSGLPRRRPLEDAALLDPANSTSRDGSLGWTVQADASCGRSVSVQAWDGKALATVLELRREAPRGGCG